jgi:TolA-binding protein
MLIKINQLSDNCEELEGEVEELKRRIGQLLKQEKREKELNERRHQEDLALVLQDNTLLKNQLKAMLTSVNN